MELRLVELFAGIGSQKKALQNIGVNVNSVGISEWSINTLIAYYCIHYSHHHQQTEEKTKEEMEKALSMHTFSLDGKNPYDVSKLSPEKLALLYKAHIMCNNLGSIKDIKELPECDLLTYSFPCQDLSSQGKGKGLINSEHSSLIWEVGRLLKTSTHKPKILLMENVPSILNPKYDFHLWKQLLEDLGYTNHVHNIKATMCEIPQNRTRTFMVSSLSEVKLDFSHLSPTKKTLMSILRDIDPYTKMSTSQTLPPISSVAKTKNGLKPITLNIKSNFNSEKRIYCIDGIAPTLTATGSNSKIKIYNGEEIRYLTPCECWLLMGFTEQDYFSVRDIGQSPALLTKHAGNSIVVNVLMEIFTQLYVSPIISITETISVESKHLDTSLKSHIHSELKTKKVGEYVKNYGYITDIISLDKIHQTYVSFADSSNKFLITFLARVIKPRINNVYEGLVKGTYTHGIFTSICLNRCSKINCNALVSLPEDGCEYKKGDLIKFKLTEMEFDTKTCTYSCAGDHVH
jgi:DNA (cytosine-5)-methyltransferase 1